MNNIIYTKLSDFDNNSISDDNETFKLIENTNNEINLVLAENMNNSYTNNNNIINKNKNSINNKKNNDIVIFRYKGIEFTENMIIFMVIVVLGLSICTMSIVNKM